MLPNLNAGRLQLQELMLGTKRPVHTVVATPTALVSFERSTNHPAVLSARLPSIILGPDATQDLRKHGVNYLLKWI